MPILSQWLDEAARHHGSQRALVYRDAYLSWRGLQHRVERRSQELRSMGVTPGTLVGLMLGNVPDFVVLALALDRLGAAAVPLDPATSIRDLDMLLEAAPIRALVTRPATNSTAPVVAAQQRPGSRPTPLALRVTDVTKAATPKHVAESKKRLAGSLLTVNFYKHAPVNLELSLPSMVAFAADAGGDPKGVLRSDAQLESIAASLGTALDAQPGQTILIPTPFHYSAGFDVGLLLGLGCQLTMVLEDEFSAKGLVRLLKDNGADLVLGTPAQYSAVCQTITVALPTPKARCLCIESPGLRAASAAFKAKFNGALIPIFHSAETGPVALDLEGVSEDESMAGRLLPGVEARVTSQDGTTLPMGVAGRLWLKTNNASPAAVPQLPRAIRSVGPVGIPIGRTDRDGWFRTGDLGFVDPVDGRLHVTGREDDLVWVEGRRVALGEVEGCLESFALVKQAEARIVYDEHKGPMVVARVVPTSACRVEDIIEHCARYLAPYKVPRHIELCRQL